MALHWEWNKKVGECEVQQFFENSVKRYRLSFYEGNALLIMLREFHNDSGQDCWEMFSFWADEAHAKNCLGISKGCENMYETEYMKLNNFVFYRKGFRQFNTVVKLISKSFKNVNIRIQECE